MTMPWGLRTRGVNYVEDLAKRRNREMVLSFKNPVLSICVKGALSHWNYLCLNGFGCYYYQFTVSKKVPKIQTFFPMFKCVWFVYCNNTSYIIHFSVSHSKINIFFVYLYCFFNARAFVWRIRRFSVAHKRWGWMQTLALIYCFVISLIDEGSVGIFFLPLLLEW